jgi:hypothetical protein
MWWTIPSVYGADPLLPVCVAEVLSDLLLLVADQMSCSELYLKW